MRELRLFAISINDVRDIFGAGAALAARLRSIASGHATPPPVRRTLLARIGPLLARDKAMEVDPTGPLPRDVEALLAGGHIPPGRLPQCWQLMLQWLPELSVQDLAMATDGLDTLEFDLARAGLPSDFSLRRLAERQLGIALRPLPGQVVGYSKHLHVAATARQLRRAHDGAPAELRGSMASIEPLLRLLEEVAARPGDALDLVVVQVPD